MFATIIITSEGKPLRSSFFQTKKDAIEHLQNCWGVVAVEEIGKGIVEIKQGYTLALSQMENPLTIVEP